MIREAHVKAVLDLWREDGVRARCTLEGDCMAPILRGGDELVIEHGSHGIRFGDIVAFRSDGRVLVHRVVGIGARDGRPHYTLKADQQAVCLPPVSEEDLIGTIREARGSNGNLSFESPLGRCINVFLASRSYVDARRYEGRPWPWRFVSALFWLRACLLPWRASLTLLPLRMIGYVRLDRRPTGASRPGDGDQEKYDA